MVLSFAEQFDLRVFHEKQFKELVDNFVQLVKNSDSIGAELFWRKVQELTFVYGEDDVDECVFALLMAGHYSEISKRGWYLFKSQEALVLSENNVITNLGI